MINNDLQNNILEFCLQFNAVTMQQIKRMFRKYSPAAIEWHVNTLAFERYLGRTEALDDETNIWSWSILLIQD